MIKRGIHTVIQDEQDGEKTNPQMAEERRSNNRR
jgi:uncharacterized protein YdeI (YjbR/CyaY-like superfamily)